MDPWPCSGTPRPTDEPGSTAQPARIGISRPANTAPTRWVVQRPQPSFGPAKPGGDAEQREPDERVGELVLAVDPGGIVHGPGEDERRWPRRGRASASPPRAGAAATSLIAPAPPPRSCPGPTTNVGISYSASAWRTARDCWRWASRPASSGSGSKTDWSRSTTTEPMPARPQRRERADERGVLRRRDDDRGHPAPEPADARSRAPRRAASGRRPRPPRGAAGS